MKIVLVCVFVSIFELFSAFDETGLYIYPARVSVDPDSTVCQVYLNIIASRSISSRQENPVKSALESFPLIDGHNDFPFQLYTRLQNNLTGFNFNTDLKYTPGWEDSHTDIPRLRKGKLGGQFWSVFVFCDTQYKDAVALTLEQIDVIKRLIKKNSEHMQFTTTADGILEAFNNGKIASMIGIEGGHSMDSRLGVLRMYYDLGVRYMTLTHSCNTPWASSSIEDDCTRRTSHLNSQLTQFGKKVVLEMNRLGMMVDLAHVARNVMYDALEISVAPVIFSHSSSYAVHPHTRNVHDDVLRLLKKNCGIIMVNFYPGYIGGGDNPDLEIGVAHINHIVDVIGPNHVGFGGDFDGIPKTLKGLEDVSKYPDLLEALYKSNPKRWTQINLEKLIGRNLVRVFKEVEAVRDKLISAEPLADLILTSDLQLVNDVNAWQCRTKYNKKIFDELIQAYNSSHYNRI